MDQRPEWNQGRRRGLQKGRGGDIGAERERGPNLNDGIVTTHFGIVAETDDAVVSVFLRDPPSLHRGSAVAEAGIPAVLGNLLLHRFGQVSAHSIS